MAKINNKPAAAYAKPHTMSGKSVNIKDVGIPLKMPDTKGWVPMEGVSIGQNQLKSDAGIKMRGTGAATKGLKSRGPMA